MKKLIYSLFVAIAFVGMTTMISCGDDDDDKGNDGKIDPSTIAATNLIAHFPFESDGKDIVGNLTPNKTEKITFPTGRRGNGYQGAENGFLLYSLSSSKIQTLNAFTVSLWVKLLATEPGGPEPMIFHVDGETDWVWGNFFLLQNRNQENQLDSAMMTNYFWKDDAVEWNGQRGDGWAVYPFNQWKHVICSYDNVSSEYHVYIDGNEYTNKDGSEYAGIKRWQGESKTIPFGALKFNVAENMSIGTWVPKAKGTDLTNDDWAGYFKGMIDEFRIYDRGLTAEEAKLLYQAEATQINE